MKLVIAGIFLIATFTLASGDDLIAGTSRWPIPACLVGNAGSFRAGSRVYPCESYQLWMYLPSLKAILEPQGVRFENVTQQPNGKRNVFIRFPQTDTPVILGEDGAWALPWQADHPEVQPDRNYFNASDLIDYGRSIGLPFALTGWNAVKLEVGTTSLTLSKNAKPLAPIFLYLDALTPQSERAFPKRSNNEALTWNTPGDFNPLETATPHRIAVKDGADSVFLVLTRENNALQFNGEIAPQSRVINIAHSDQNGVLEFLSRAKTLEFVTDTTKLELNPVGGQGRAVVVKFTGRLDVGATAFTAVDSGSIAAVK